MAQTGKKKVVRVESTAGNPPDDPKWKPTPEAKGRATRLRVIAWILWLLAIAGEAATAIWLLKDPINMVYLIGAIVVIGILASVGSTLWKKANRADPAHRSQAFRFWVQNQLGVIMTLLAFVPLIILIFMNKDMDGKQKGIAGAVAVVVALIATFAFGASYNSPSVEQYTEETQRVIELTGEDLVYWTKEGEVYHLCEQASAVNLESEDNTIYSGTVGDAHAAGKERLTLQVEQELNQCGLPPEGEPQPAASE